MRRSSAGSNPKAPPIARGRVSVVVQRGDDLLALSSLFVAAAPNRSMQARRAGVDLPGAVGPPVDGRCLKRAATLARERTRPWPTPRPVADGRADSRGVRPERGSCGARFASSGRSLPPWGPRTRRRGSCRRRGRLHPSAGRAARRSEARRTRRSPTAPGPRRAERRGPARQRGGRRSPLPSGRRPELKVVGRVERQPFARASPSIDRLQRLDRVADRRGRLSFGLPAIDEGLEVGGRHRAQLPRAELRQDPLLQRLAVPPQGRGLVDAAGTIADLPGFRPFKPRGRDFAQRPAARRPHRAVIEGAFFVGAPRLRFGFAGERLVDLLAVARGVSPSLIATVASTPTSSLRRTALGVALDDPFSHRGSR